MTDTLRQRMDAQITTLPSDARVVVGMSGGVDSSVAAKLLIEAGFTVEGLFMKNWEEDDGTEYCTAIEDYDDARAVSDTLGIELHTANFAAEYWDNVFESFLTEYRAGRTPNPDVLCNREIKFKHFADYSRMLGADAIATGHYVRGVMGSQGFELHKGADANKDQSYFLQAVARGRFDGTVFPLGDIDKNQVRQMAEQFGFHNHRKKDSTGICFIGERRFRDFLERYVAKEPGPIVDTHDHEVGEHSGLAYYTLGQRQGLGIGGIANRPESPWYVVAKNKADNTLVVTQNEADLMSRELTATSFNWLADLSEFGSRQDVVRCQAKVRYRQADQSCTLEPLEDDRWRACFDEPQRAVTPGQYICLYDGTRCLGGGVIEDTELLPC